MPIWTKSGQLPKTLSRKDKRMTVATDRGFVKRRVYTDRHSNVRVKDELLVALEGVANSSNFGAPSISDIWFSSSRVVANTAVTLRVSYDEPIAYANSTIGALQINVANTVNGEAIVATSNTTISGSNNTIVFTFTPTVAGTYAIQGQTLSNATATPITSLKSTNSGNEAIDLVVSNTAASWAGTLVVTAS